MRIPVASAPTEAPRPVGTPFTRSEATPEAFGAGIGKAISDAATVANQYSVQEYSYQQDQAEKAKQRAQAANVLDADTLVSNGFRDVLDKPETGYLSSTAGKAAVEARPGVHESLQKIIEAAGKNLATPEEKAAFKQRASQRLEHAIGRVEAHAAGGLKKAAVDSAEGAYQAALQNVMSAPESLRAEYTAMLGPLSVLSSNTGTPAEVLQQKFQRDAAEAALKAYLGREDVVGAQQLLKDHPFLAPHTKQVEALGVQKDAEVQAENDLPSVLKPSGEVDYELVQSFVDARPEGPQRDAYRERLGQRVAVSQKLWNDKRGELAARVQDEGQVLGESGTMRFSWGAVSNKARFEFEQVDPERAAAWKRKSKLDAAIEAKTLTKQEEAARNLEERTAYADALQDFALFKDQIASMDRDTFIGQYAPFVNSRQFSQLLGRYENLKKNADKLTEESVVHARLLRALGLPKGEPVPEDKMDLFVAYAESAREGIREYTARTGKPPDMVAMEQILGRVEKDVVIEPGRFYDSTGPAYEKRALDKKARQGTVQFDPSRLVPPAGKPTTPAAKALPVVKNNQEWTKLPSGTRYVGPDGRERVKR